MSRSFVGDGNSFLAVGAVVREAVAAINAAGNEEKQHEVENKEEDQHSDVTHHVHCLNDDGRALVSAVGALLQVRSRV